MIKQSTRLALMLLGLTACATSQTTSMPPLPKPIVSCGEHIALEPLPPYPSAPRLAGLDDHAKAEALEHYSASQSLWAIGAAGITQRNAIKRNGTTSCLDDLRRRGVIQ